jgi:hypothetical protein
MMRLLTCTLRSKSLGTVGQKAGHQAGRQLCALDGGDWLAAKGAVKGALKASAQQHGGPGLGVDRVVDAPQLALGAQIGGERLVGPVRAGSDGGEGLALAGQQGRLGEQRCQHGKLALVKPQGLVDHLF